MTYRSILSTLKSRREETPCPSSSASRAHTSSVDSTGDSEAGRAARATQQRMYGFIGVRACEAVYYSYADGHTQARVPPRHEHVCALRMPLSRFGGGLDGQPLSRFGGGLDVGSLPCPRDQSLLTYLLYPALAAALMGSLPCPRDQSLARASLLTYLLWAASHPPQGPVVGLWPGPAARSHDPRSVCWSPSARSPLSVAHHNTT